MTTANSAVLAQMISGLDGDYHDGAQVFVSAAQPEHFPTGSTVSVTLRDAVEEQTREFIVTVEEVR